MSTRVLIVDDSATMRAILKTMLGKESDINVVGTAAIANTSTPIAHQGAVSGSGCDSL
jgi:chemotaxis response regulator CheB